MIWLDRYVEKKRPNTPEQKGELGLGQVRQRRHPDARAHMELAGRADTIMRDTMRLNINDYRLQVAEEVGSVPHCDWARRCVVDTAFHPAHLHLPLVAGRPPDGRLPGSHQPHEGSKVRYTW